MKWRGSEIFKLTLISYHNISRTWMMPYHIISYLILSCHMIVWYHFHLQDSLGLINLAERCHLESGFAGSGQPISSNRGNSQYSAYTTNNSGIKYSVEAKLLCRIQIDERFMCERDARTLLQGNSVRGMFVLSNSLYAQCAEISPIIVELQWNWHF